MKRYVSYDIKEENSYEDLYNYFDEVNAEKITESTYRVDSKLNLDSFCTKLKNLTSPEDTVVVISGNAKGAFHRKVR